MKITTPILRVNASRDAIVDSLGQEWFDAFHFKRIGFQFPVTKSFYLTIADYHVPYAVEVNFSRATGMLRSGATGMLRSGYSSMAVGNPFREYFMKNLLPSGTYYIAITNSSPAAPVIKVFEVPVDISYSAVVTVEADDWQQALRFVRGKNASELPVKNEGVARVSMAGTPREVASQSLRIGAIYFCKSSSRPQINKKEVTLREIRTAKQVQVVNEHGDTYLTNPSNLTYIRG